MPAFGLERPSNFWYKATWSRQEIWRVFRFRTVNTVERKVVRMHRSTAPLGISAALNVSGGGLPTNVIQVVVDALPPRSHPYLKRFHVTSRLAEDMRMSQTSMRVNIQKYVPIRTHAHGVLTAHSDSKDVLSPLIMRLQPIKRTGRFTCIENELICWWYGRDPRARRGSLLRSEGSWGCKALLFPLQACFSAKGLI